VSALGPALLGSWCTAVARALPDAPAPAHPAARDRGAAHVRRAGVV